MRSWTAQNLNTDEGRDPPAPPRDRASWYAQGASDAIGDRLLMFDNSGGTSLELLRFSWKIVAFPGFEAALRERVELLTQFRHPAFSKVRAVEKLEPKNDLTLVSNYVSGKRLTDELAALRGPAFAMWFIRELVPALASLEQQARGVAHGALTADRIVLTAEGRLVIVEHVLGSALDRLQLSRNEMWLRFGIATPPTAGTMAVLDGRADAFQLGLVALSVLLGRTIASYEYPHRLGELLDRFEQTSGHELPSSLRTWLVRALHIDGKPFDSAQDAEDGLGELAAAPVTAALPGESAPVVTPRVMGRLEQAPRPIAAMAELVLNEQGYQTETLPNREWSEVTPRTSNEITSSGNKGRYGTWEREVVAADLLTERRFQLGQLHSWRFNGLATWALAALSVLAVAQAAYIGYLLYSPAPAIVIETPQPAPNTIARNPAEADRMLPTAQAADLQAPVKPLEPTTASAAAARSGGVRLVSEVEVQLLDGDRVLGSSTEGPIVTTAGRHEFELVNSVLGYRSKQVVNIKPGEIFSLRIPRPEGRISINAVPWADIWIDRVHIGETPLANLAIPIGQHEVSFRHPSLGEQRRTTIVRYDVPTRLSADLR